METINESRFDLQAGPYMTSRFVCELEPSIFDRRRCRRSLSVGIVVSNRRLCSCSMINWMLLSNACCNCSDLTAISIDRIGIASIWVFLILGNIVLKSEIFFFQNHCPNLLVIIPRIYRGEYPPFRKKEERNCSSGQDRPSNHAFMTKRAPSVRYSA